MYVYWSFKKLLYDEKAAVIAEGPGSATNKVLCHLWFVILVTVWTSKGGKKNNLEYIGPVCSLPSAADFKEKCVNWMWVCPCEAAGCCWRNSHSIFKIASGEDAGKKMQLVRLPKKKKKASAFKQTFNYTVTSKLALKTKIC